MIRAQTPVVAATAPPAAPTRPGAVAAPAPPLPPLTPQVPPPPLGGRPIQPGAGAAPPPPLTNGNGRVAATPLAPPAPTLPATAPNGTPPAPAPAPPAPLVDEFLPATAAAAAAAAPTEPRDEEDLLPLVPVTVAKPKATDKLPHVALERKYWFMAGGAVLLIVALAVGWMLTKDDVKSQIDAPVQAVDKAEQIAGQSRLNTAAIATASVYADQGTFANMTPQVLRANEPSIVWLGPSQAATSGQVSVRVVDPDTVVLVTALPNKSCEGLYQARGASTEVPVRAPCSAARAQLPGTGGPR
jgi:hypothetical protein